MKHKIGEQVKIRPDLTLGKEYDDEDVTEEMCTYSGQVLTIAEVDKFENCYYMEEDEGYFAWTDSMFECEITNADMIRSLDDEDLALWLRDVYKGLKSYDEILNWLKTRWCA